MYTTTHVYMYTCAHMYACIHTCNDSVDGEVVFCDPDMVLYEYELRIGWGKAVSLPSNALPAPPPGQMAVRPKEFDVHGNAAIAWSEPGGGAAASLGLTGLNTEVVRGGVWDTYDVYIT